MCILIMRLGVKKIRNRSGLNLFRRGYLALVLGRTVQTYIGKLTNGNFYFTHCSVAIVCDLKKKVLETRAAGRKFDAKIKYRPNLLGR